MNQKTFEVCKMQKSGKKEKQAISAKLVSLALLYNFYQVENFGNPNKFFSIWTKIVEK